MTDKFLLMMSKLLSSQVSASSSTATLLEPSPVAPLFISAITSILSFIASSRNRRKTEQDPDLSIASFRASIESPVRDASWRSLYGLSYPVFTTVVEKLSPYLAQCDLFLPTDFAISMVLCRLCHGYSVKTLASMYKLDPYLIIKTSNMVTRLLATKIYHEFIKFPTEERRLIELAQGFEEITSLPNMCGAIDGSPVKLKKVNNDDGDGLKCRYGYKAVLLQVVADHKKMFWDVCVKAGGGTGDENHFRDSLLYHRFMHRHFVWDRMVHIGERIIRPYMVGDWCYPLMPFLMTPYSLNGLGTPAQNLFDRMLMKGRSVVTEAVGLLKGRWRILQDLNVDLNHAPQTIVACCVLHNLCQMMGEPEPELWEEPEESGPCSGVQSREVSFFHYAACLRDALANDLHQRFLSM